MRKLMLALLVLLVVVLIVGCGKIEENIETDPQSGEESVSEDVPTISFFDLLELNEEEILQQFNEEPQKWEGLEHPHIFFKEQNIIFMLDEGKVFEIGVLKGNQILGIEIGDEYNEDYIIQELGQPDQMGVIDMKAGTVEYMTYFMLEKYHVTFLKNYAGVPFSAGVALIEP